EGARHNEKREPQRRGSVPPLHTRKRNRSLSKTTLGVGVHVQPVGLNAETKKGSAPSRRKEMSLDIPLYRTFPVTALSLTMPAVARVFSYAQHSNGTHLFVGAAIAS